MPTKFKFKYGFKANAERLAEKFRADLLISKFDPLDAFQLAAHLSVPIKTVNEFSAWISDEQLSVLTDTSKFSAMWMPNSDGEKIILHNDRHSEKRQQSNLMHELSHIILNHEIPEEIARLCFLYGLSYYNTEQEQEAKYLGATMLETVSRAAAHDPHVVEMWMAVDQKITRVGVLVLTDARLGDRRVRKRRHPLPQPRARGLDACSIGNAVLDIGVDRRTVTIDPDLHAAMLELRDAVDPRREINPRGGAIGTESIVAGRRSKVHDHLPRRSNATAEEIGKELRKPWATCEHKRVGMQLSPAR
jgi:hypothetical protein